MLMESTGVPDEVHISEAAYLHIRSRQMRRDQVRVACCSLCCWRCISYLRARCIARAEVYRCRAVQEMRARRGIETIMNSVGERL